MQKENSQKWYYTIWGVILLILLIGPIAFIFLWKSESFALSAKILISVLTTLITIWLIVGSTEAFLQALKQLQF